MFLAVGFLPDVFFLSCSILSSLPDCTGWASWFFTFYSTMTDTRVFIYLFIFLQKPRKAKTFYFYLWNVCIHFLSSAFFNLLFNSQKYLRRKPCVKKMNPEISDIRFTMFDRIVRFNCLDTHNHIHSEAAEKAEKASSDVFFQDKVMQMETEW